MTSHSTHISVAHGDGAVVTVKPTDDGRWFRVLNWLVDAGHWSRLTDAQRNVFVVILRHRRTDDKLAPVLLPAICGATGLRESAVYEAVKGLLAHNPPLLRKHAPGLWEPFPQRSFKARPDPTAASIAHKSPDPPGSAVAESSPPWRNPVQQGGLSPSHSPSAQKDQDKEQQQQPISLTLEDARDEIAAAAIALARKAGIPEATSLEHLNAHGARKLYNAIVEARTRKGAPIRDVSGWVRSALARGYELPDHWAMECGRREREARMRGDAANLLRKMAAAWSGDDMAVILAAFGTAEQLAAWLDEREPFGLPWRSYGADRLGRKIADAVMAGTKQESKA